MGFVTESAIGGAGVSIVVGAFLKGVFGNGLFSVQVAVSLCLLSLIPLLRRVSASVPKYVVYIFFFLASFFVLPSLAALIMELFTGHRRPGAGPESAIWRVVAILALWIGFAKVNEEFIRPALRNITYFQSAGGSIARHSNNMALGKREKALEDIKARLVPVLVRRKKAEKVVQVKEVEIEKAEKNFVKSVALFEKGKARIEAARNTSAELGELEEEVESLESLVNNAEAYKLGLENQIATAKEDIKECAELGKKLQAEWTEALHINNHVEFYR